MITDLLKVGTEIIRHVIPDKEAQRQAEAELAKMQLAGETKELEVRMSAIIAEATSKDKWTSRARPSFKYVFYALILAGIPMGILSAASPDTAEAVAGGFKMWLDAVPEHLYTMFGVGYLGYAGARSFDKREKSKGNA